MRRQPAAVLPSAWPALEVVQPSAAQPPWPTVRYGTPFTSSLASTASVLSKRIVKRVAKLDAEVTSLDDVRRVDLQVADRLLRTHTFAYGLSLAAEGAATSLAIPVRSFPAP